MPPAIRKQPLSLGGKVAGAKPVFTANLRFLAASLAALDRLAEANDVAHLILQLELRFAAKKFAASYALSDEERRRQFCEHLIRQACLNRAGSVLPLVQVSQFKPKRLLFENVPFLLSLTRGFQHALPYATT